MKKIVRIAKLQFVGGGVKPGPALASVGVNIGEFCNQFNRATENRKGDIVPVVLTVYNDRSFEFVTKTTPTAVLVKKYAKIEKGSGNSKKDSVGALTMTQVEEIAKHKLLELNTDNLAQAVKIILGTMKQMGVEIKANETSNTPPNNDLKNSENATKK